MIVSCEWVPNDLHNLSGRTDGESRDVALANGDETSASVVGLIKSSESRMDSLRDPDDLDWVLERMSTIRPKRFSNGYRANERGRMEGPIVGRKCDRVDFL